MQTRDAQWWVVDGGRRRGFGQGDPDIEGELGSDVVESKRGEQADDGFWYAAAYLGECLVLGDLGIREAVQTVSPRQRMTGSTR